MFAGSDGSAHFAAVAHGIPIHIAYHFTVSGWQTHGGGTDPHTPPQIDQRIVRPNDPGKLDSLHVHAMFMSILMPPITKVCVASLSQKFPAHAIILL